MNVDISLIYARLWFVTYAFNYPTTYPTIYINVFRWIVHILLHIVHRLRELEDFISDKSKEEICL